MNKIQIIPAVDKSGNRIVKIRRPGERGFSIKTEGNLPLAHLMADERFPKHQRVLAFTVRDYVLRYGTPRQINMVIDCGWGR